MSKFALEKIKAIKGKQSFYDLKVNEVGQFESFSNKLEEQYKRELVTLNARMDLVANLNRLPKEKFRDITPKKQTVKEYEFKTKHLRLYAIHIEKTGKVIVLGGHKNTQKSDIPSFRSLKSQFLKSLDDDK
jgi:putative component of toxin-antitoxin plasmid stabilization module